MPESIRRTLSVPERMGAEAAGRVMDGRYNNGTVPVAGRYGTPPVVIEKPAGIPVEFAGFDAVTSQARQTTDLMPAGDPLVDIESDEA